MQDYQAVIVDWINLQEGSKEESLVFLQDIPLEVVRAIFDQAHIECVRKCERVRQWFWYEADGYECGDPKNDETEWSLEVQVGVYKIQIFYSDYKPQGCTIVISSQSKKLFRINTNLLKLYDEEKYEYIITKLTNY